MAIIYFRKEEFNPLVRNIILKFKTSTFDLEIPISKLFYGNLIDLERDNDFLIKIMNSDLRRRMVHAFLHYLEEKSKSVIDYKDIILSMGHHLMKNKGEETGGWGFEDKILRSTIWLYDETSESTLPEMKYIAEKCLDIWDLMFEKQIGPVRQLSQKLMDR
jgi:hypothetical protein